VFAAIYHPVGMAMLIEVSRARGRTLAFNGVCGNLGVSLSAGITAALASWIGWRGAFLVPAAVCLVTGGAYFFAVADERNRGSARKTVADVVLPPRAATIMFALYVVISIAGGLTFNTLLIALPKIIDERLGTGVPLIAVGGVATGVFLCGALAQIAVGRLVERFAPHLLFAIVIALQFAGSLWAASAPGATIVAPLALTMAAVYGQVTVGDLVIARYTADAWRGRVYALRYFLAFLSSGIAVSAIAFLYARGGFGLVLAAIAAVGGVLLAAVLGFVSVIEGVERSRKRAVAPAE